MTEGESRSSVTVTIAGEQHTLRSTAEPEYTRRCAAFLEDRVKEIRTISRLADGHRAVILAALSITDRYFQTLDELERVRHEFSTRSEALADRLEEELGRGASAA